MKKLYIQKVHEKWSIFCFYGNPWIVVVFEIIAFEVGDFWNLCITTKTWSKKFVLESIKVGYWRENFLAVFVSRWKKKFKKKFRVNTQLLLIQRRIFLLCSCFRCNTQISKTVNFKRDYPNNNNDSEVTSTPVD
jgi:hypothetical protein